MGYFVLGFAFALLLTMVTTTTPAQARENLRAWKALIWRAPPPPSEG
jgi:hypothetical protein